MHIQVQERPRAPARTGQPLPARIRQGFAELWNAKPFLVFVTGKAVYNLGLSLVSALIAIYWIKYLQISDAWVGYFATTSTAATLVSYAPWVRLKRRYGTRWTLIVSVLGTGMYPALLALAPFPVAVFPMIALNGLAAGGLNLALFDALLDLCPRAREERFIAINITALNLVGMIGPPIGAALLGMLHIRWVLALGSLVALLGVAIFAQSGRSAMAVSCADRPEEG